MAASEWQQLFTLRSGEVALSALPSMLDKVSEALKDTEALSCLMVDYWNSAGAFADYTVGRQELTRRIADCIGGSAFGEAAEVRWRKVGDAFRAVLVAEADLSYLPLQRTGTTWRLEDGEIERALRGNDRSEKSILFWGSRLLTDGTWVEARIPRPLTYPTMQKRSDSYDHVRLHFVEYRDERGRVIIHRRTHLAAHRQQPRSSQETKQEGEENHGQTTV